MSDGTGRTRASLALVGGRLLTMDAGDTVADARAAGVDGFIVVDLQPEGGANDEFLGACRDHGLAFVPLVAPTSTEARLRTIAAASAAPASGGDGGGDDEAQASTGSGADLPRRRAAWAAQPRLQFEF